MANRKRKRRSQAALGRYRFRQKVHSTTAKIALAIAGVMLLWYLLFVGISFLENGMLSPYYGSAGVLAMVLSIISLIMALWSRFEDNVWMMYPNLALLVSLAAAVCWTGTYGMGLSL